jgi:NOL1/NOP2/sun family putative RNA methylase
VPPRGRRRHGHAVELSRYQGFIREWDAFTAAAARPEPTVFRVRAGRVTEAALLDRLERQGFRLEPVAGLPAFYRVLEEPYPVSMTLEHWAGLVYVQQASTGIAPPELGVRPGERVLDLCSAPGGKTTHLAELMDDRGCLVASEIDERRIRGLLGNVYRLCHPSVVTVACDGRDFPEGAFFDRVLVDAPCSGEGTLRRRSGDVPNQSKSFLGYVTGVQRALLQKAVRLCRPGGTILYVTCTFSPDENEAVVSDVLASCPVELEPLRLGVPHTAGLTSFEGTAFDPRLEGAARIYPHHLDSGGLFMAKLRRLGGGVAAAPDAGWRPVPVSFPDGALGEDDARALVAGALVMVAERYGIPPSELERRGWIVRGGRIWTHSVDEWPLEAWAEGPWRPISVGVRALEIDSRGRPRPTNDFLRLLGEPVSRARIDLTGAQLHRLLDRHAEPVSEELLGPVALGFEGSVLGRGALTPEGLCSEIPKARAADLKRVLAARAASGATG